MKVTKKIITVCLLVIFIVGFFFYYSLNHLQYFNRGKNNTTVTETNINQNICTRTKPFHLNQEFNSALDLIQQRSKSAEDIIKISLKPKERLPRFFSAIDSRNCLDIFYSDNIPNLNYTNAWFDSENSTPNHLIIKIDPKYKDSRIDNLVMAMLLAHELTHVRQYFDIKSGDKMTCIQQEVDSFLSQLRFLAILNKDEQPQVMNLIKTKYYYVLGTFYDIWIGQDRAATECNKLQPTGQFNQNGFNVCYWEKMQAVAEGYIQTIPGYKEHCKLK
ncbi:MAG: hypothetical protein WAV30_02160 [Microgenomates group bacterium]